MILSDRSIKELCTPSMTKFNREAYEAMRTALYVQLGRELLEDRYGGTQTLDLVDKLRFLRSRCHVLKTEEELDAWRPMIEPFSAELVREVVPLNPLSRSGKDNGVCVADGLPHKIISRGLTSYGYDVSLADDFKVFTNINSAVIDPKRLDPKCLASVTAQYDESTGERYVLMPPNSYLLGSTVEYFVIPRDIMVICVGKSTYARSGAIVNVTPIEPGFEGNVVIEISNSTNLPAKVYAGEGIAQFMFFRGDQECETSYGDRGGKYQGQTGLTLPKV